MGMVSVCLPSDALLQHLPSYLGFSYLGRGVSPHHCPSWPLKWDGSSRPSCARAATAPWTRGSSSGPPPLTSDLGSSSWPFLHCRSLALSAAAPDLGRGVTPLGRCPSDMGSTRLLPLTLDLGSCFQPRLVRRSWPPVLSVLSNHTRTTALSNSMKLSHALWGHPRWRGHGGEV